MRFRVIAAVCASAVLAATGLGGCSLFTPPLSEAPAVEKNAQVIEDSYLVTPGTLTVAMDTSDAPQAMVLSEGVEGYDVDVARSLAERMGLELAVVSGTSAESTVGAGTADLYLGAETTDAAEGITVSGVYLENATAVFGTSDAASLTAADLAAATVAVQDGSASQEALVRSAISATQSTYSNVNACFDALAAGEVDYVVCDATAGAYLARAYPGVSFEGTLSSSTAFGLAIASDAHELSDAVSSALDEISSDGTLDAIHTVWYGTMPFSLSDTVVSGVTISAITDAAQAQDEAEAEASEDGESLDSLNSLD